MSIADLRRSRAAAAQQMKAASDAIRAHEAAALAADSEAMQKAIADFDAAKAAFDRASEQLARAEAVEAAEAAIAQGDMTSMTPTAGNGLGGAATVPALASDPQHRGVAAGFMVHALAQARGDRDKAVAALERAGHGAISAVLNGAVETAGGVTIPQAQTAELIALLSARVVVRASGARTFPMPAGQIRRAKQIAPATATYTGEASAIAVSTPEFDKQDMAFKKLTAMVPISNDLLRYSNLQMATIVRDDLLRVMALREDLAFLRGDGAGDTPTGVLHWIPAENWASGIAATAAAAEAAIRRAVSVVEDSNVAMTAPGWVMRASAKNFLAALRDPLGHYLFPSIDQNGTLKGFPIRTTAQIPDNLGPGGDETEIYFGDWSEAMIGDSMALTVDQSNVASFVDADGSTISAFQNDLTVMRAISEHDFAPEHDVGFSGFRASGWSL